MLPEFVDRTGGSQWVQAKPLHPQGILRIRRNQPLQSMAVDFVARIRGSQWNRALPGGGKWLRVLPGGGKWLRVLPNTKNLEALIYGRQIRVLFGGSKWVQAQPAWLRMPSRLS